MRFGDVPVADAKGAIAAHAVRIGEFALRKGQVIAESDQAALAAAGIETIIAARLDPGDVGEDLAATRLASMLAGPGLRLERAFTGRVNLFAEVAGLVEVDIAAIDGVNEIDEAITVATLPAYRTIAPGDMAATVKIIPFSASGESLGAAESIPGASGRGGHVRGWLARARKSAWYSASVWLPPLCRLHWLPSSAWRAG